MRISDWSSDVCSSDLRPGRNRAASKQVEKSRQHDAAKQNYGYGTGVAPPPPIRSDMLGLQTRRRGWQAGGLLHALLLDVDRARNGCSAARTAQEAAADPRPERKSGV